MAGEAEVWWDDLRQDAEAPAAPPRTSRTPVLLGALAAVAASAGLAWWLSAPAQEPASVTPTPRPAAVATPATPLAPLAADAEQVRRAYEQFTLVYASSGADGLARFSESCEQSLKGDGRILDFCLAFDLFAGSVRAAPGEEIPGKAEARRLALLRAALPAGVGADQRLAEVRSLMRATIGVTAPAKVEPARVVLARAEPRPRARPAPKAPPICIQANVADRLVCANPALASQERRMKAAYVKALAAGADPLAVDRGQAEWRELRETARERGALSDLYARRIRELEAIAGPSPQEPPAG